MPEAEPTLLLTRPQSQSQAFLNMCEARLGRRLPVVISPLIRIEPVGEIPDLDRYATIVITSGNGVARLGSALAGRVVRTVGERTAEKARRFGANSESLGHNLDALLANSSAIKGAALVVRGVHARGDLAGQLRNAGVPAEEAVIYDQPSVPLNPAARGLLSGPAAVIAPVFSPRTAKLLGGTTIQAPITIIAISAATADAWRGGGKVRVAEKPDAEAMCDLVEQAF